MLRELVAQMPNENYIFFGDSKNAPYGTKTLEEVQKLTCADAEYLLSCGVKALVVACNTATSAAIRILREKYVDMPVIGIEPALKPAVHAGGAGTARETERRLKDCGLCSGRAQQGTVELCNSLASEQMKQLEIRLLQSGTVQAIIKK